MELNPLDCLPNIPLGTQAVRTTADGFASNDQTVLIQWNQKVPLGFGIWPEP